jgi:hypothetical protein
MRKAFDLRPLDFSDVLGRSFSLYTANFVGYLRWFSIMWLLPMLVVSGLLYLALNPFDWVGIPGRESPSLVEPNRYAAYFWLVKIAAVVFAFTTGASGVYYMTARVYVGGNPGLNEVMRAVGKRFSHVAGAGFMHEIALVGITFGCLAPPFLLWEGDKGFAVLAGFVGWLAWLPLMLWYTAVFALNTPAIMLDDAEATEAYQRSAFLTKRSRGRLMGVTLVTVLVVGAPGIPGLLSIPAIVGRELLVDAEFPLIALVVELAWDAVLLPLFFIPLVVYYFDMRCRKESYDLAVMARNFGIDEAEMARFRFNPDLGYMPKGWKGERSRREKIVRPPQPRMPQPRMPVGPWGPQPGITGGPFGGAQGGQWAPPPDQQQWGPPQNPQWGPPPQNSPQGGQWAPPQPQNPQWAPGPPNPQFGPINPAQGRPFDPPQGRPFDPPQGRPFDPPQGRPFDPPQGRPPRQNPFYGRPGDGQGGPQ